MFRKSSDQLSPHQLLVAGEKRIKSSVRQETNELISIDIPKPCVDMIEEEKIVTSPHAIKLNPAKSEKKFAGLFQ